MGYIYKITNLLNNKIYIGQTIFTVEKRWDQHKTASLIGETKLYRAMRKYGIENFSIETLEKCENELLSEKEIKWIKFYNSYLNGYNMTLGGEGTRIIDHVQVIESWNEGLNIKEISLLLGHSTQHIANHLVAEGITRETIKGRGLQTTLEKHQQEVIQYDLNGKQVKKYNSITQASKESGIDKSKIVSVCKNKSYSAGGFLWIYADKEHKINELVDNYKNKKIGGKQVIKKVGQYNSKGELINTYPTLSAAAKAVNGFSSNISKVCNGKQKTSYGYIWKFLEQ